MPRSYLVPPHRRIFAAGFGANCGRASTDFVQGVDTSDPPQKTISVWVYARAWGDFMRVWDRNAAELIMYASAVANIQYQRACTTGNEAWIQNTSGFEAGRWHHLAYAADFSVAPESFTPRFFMNGRPTWMIEVTGGSTAFTARSELPCWANRTTDFARVLDGALAEPTIYNRVLSGSEIWRLAQGAHPMTVARDALVEFIDLRQMICYPSRRHARGVFRPFDPPVFGRGKYEGPA